MDATRNIKKLFLLILGFLVISSCNLQRSILGGKNVEKSEFKFACVNNNVCKRLEKKVVIYAVFVDTKVTHPWTAFDINSTLDSIQLAVKWLEQQAHCRYIDLEITIANPNFKGHIPVPLDLPKKTLSNSLFQPNLQLGIKAVNRWADKVAGAVGKTLFPDTSKIISTKNTLNNKERLIAYLRDYYKTDNVALIYFINNYYKEETSVAINAGSRSDVEYAIVSFKEPSVIAHEFLHLQGAIDLYKSPFDRSKKEDKGRKDYININFPNEIMAYSYRNINSLEISPFTEYCIGWTKKMDEKYAEMVIGNKFKPISY